MLTTTDNTIPPTPKKIPPLVPPKPTVAPQPTTPFSSEQSTVTVNSKPRPTNSNFQAIHQQLGALLIHQDNTQQVLISRKAKTPEQLTTAGNEQLSAPSESTLPNRPVPVVLGGLPPPPPPFEDLGKFIAPRPPAATLEESPNSRFNEKKKPNGAHEQPELLEELKKKLKKRLHKTDSDSNNSSETLVYNKDDNKDEKKQPVVETKEEAIILSAPKIESTLVAPTNPLEPNENQEVALSGSDNDSIPDASDTDSNRTSIELNLSLSTADASAETPPLEPVEITSYKRTAQDLINKYRLKKLTEKTEGRNPLNEAEDQNAIPTQRRVKGKRGKKSAEKKSFFQRFLRLKTRKKS
jgi:hypothetical protein